jgi:hypothetical protein
MEDTIQISVRDTRGLVRSYYKSTEPRIVYDEEEALVMLMVNGIRSGPYDDDIDKLDLYYREKLTRLRVIFGQTTEPYAIFHMPLWDDMIWIQLNNPAGIESFIPLFKELGMFEANRDCLSDFIRPVDAIGLDFRTTTIAVFKLMFLICKEKVYTD